MKRVFAVAAAALIVLQPLAAFAGCTVYEHRDFKGASWYLDSGEDLIGIEDRVGCTGGCDATYFSEPSWNDVISSFDVDPGCKIYMWEHVFQAGAYWYDDEGYSYVGGDWNDAISEVYCYCK